MAAQIAAVVAALLLLDASTTFENVWPTPAIRWTGEISIELAVCVLLLAVVAAYRQPAGGSRATRPTASSPSWLAGLWVLLAIGRYADVTAPALYGRDVNLYWDLRFIPDVVAMVTTVARAGLLAASFAIVVVLCGALFIGLRWAWRRVDAAVAAEPIRRPLGTVALAVIVLFVVQHAIWHRQAAFATPVSATYARQVRFVVSALLTRSPLPASPRMESDFSRVRGADVFLVFVEAYGAVAYTKADIARGLAPARAQLEASIRDTHREVVSALVESPTFAGSSWLAHISVLSGVQVRDPDTNARLLTEPRQTLPRAFERAGYRTVALMPGLRQAWPEGSFYGFDDIYGANRLAYRGPEFGWFAIPDEYALQRLDALEVAKAPRPPLFVFFPTISTHFPFSPTPPYQPDWTRMADAHPYDGPSIVRAYAKEPDWVNFTSGYVDALAYDFTTLGGYLRLRAGRDIVMIVVGDHQPAAAVTGAHASWNVPVHVIASRPAVLERLRAKGFAAGLTPSHSLGPMNTLTTMLLDAFGPP